MCSTITTEKKSSCRLIYNISLPRSIVLQWFAEILMLSPLTASSPTENDDLRKHHFTILPRFYKFWLIIKVCFGFIDPAQHAEHIQWGRNFLLIRLYNDFERIPCTLVTLLFILIIVCCTGAPVWWKTANNTKNIFCLAHMASMHVKNTYTSFERWQNVYVYSSKQR